jgi:trk system potassium uptake protein TrkH
MNFWTVLSLIGTFLIFLGLLMLIPCGVSLYCGELDSFAFLLSMGITSLLGVVMWLLSKRKVGEFRRKECFATVAIGWFVAACAAALPFIFAGTFESPIDAFFESMSGLTTTGATVIDNIELQSHGIRLWRSFLCWLGGMGIIVLFITVLPNVGVRGTRLFNAEVPGPAPGKLEPRIRQTARMLWIIYTAMTLLAIGFLLLGGMDLFDAVNHGLAAMSTGGVSTQQTSIAYWQSPFLRFVVVIFMFASGINFSLYFQVFKGHVRDLIRDDEFRSYVLIIFVGMSIVTFDLYLHNAMSFVDSIGNSLFHVVSMITTTGFVTSDYELWPPLSKAILFVLMFIGGCAGSASGGMKVGRVLVFVKHAFKEVSSSLDPNVVRVSKVNGIPIKPSVLSRIMGFMAFYILTFILATFIMAGLGLDPVSACTSVASCLGNVGAGFGLVGPMAIYTSFPATGKLVLSFCMMLGRLELFTVLVLFTPEFWRRF